MKKFLLLISVFLGLMAFVLPAQATTLTFGLDFEFSGATEPEGLAPWITATFDDAIVVSEDTVRLTMSAGNLTDNEFISKWLFNFDDDLDATGLTFALVGSPGSTPLIYTTNIVNNTTFKADGDGFFDILFDFPTENEKDFRFTRLETVVYDISFTSAIDVSAFNFGSAPGGGSGTYYSAAHIQGIGINDADSGWIGDGGVPIPEPASMLLLGCGLIGLAAFGRRKSRKG